MKKQTWSQSLEVCRKNLRISENAIGNMKKITSVFVVIALFFGGFASSQIAEAKMSSYISNSKYIGTYGYKGNKGRFHIVKNNTRNIQSTLTVCCLL